jgi:protein tyrosine/serine phosphatase
VFVALLLSLLGVDDEDNAREYVLTETGLKEQKPMYVERLMATDAFSDPNGPGEAGAIRMTTCTRENMLATLEMMRAKYGSAERYCREACGLSGDELEAIRTVMVVEGRTGAGHPTL